MWTRSCSRKQRRMLEPQLPSLTRVRARQIIATLRDGIAPNDPLTLWLTVGQEAIRQEFDRDLDAVAQGEFRRMLLLGDPGAGKSHLMTVLRYLASARRFV